MTDKNHPNAIEIKGEQYLKNSKGNLVPLANIRPIDLIMDEMVGQICDYGEDLSAEIARFQAHTYADIAGFDALLEQEYRVEPSSASKGNRTFVSFDGCKKVQVAVSDRIVLGPELQSAKAILDAIIIERGEGVDPFLVSLVKQAFKVDQEGKVDVHSILALRRMQVEDARWPDFCRAIDDSVRVIGSKRYLRIYTRESGDAQWKMVPLDMAGVEPTPAAFERKSLRRQVEELTQKLTLVSDYLNLAQSYSEDGAYSSMLMYLDNARQICGFTLGPHDLTIPGIAGATASVYVRLWLATVPPELLAEVLGQDVAASVQKALGDLSQVAA